MRKKIIQSLTFSCLAVFAVSCVSFPSSGKNPWAAPEKKKSFAERWDEKTKETETSTAENKPAPAPVPAETSTQPAAAPTPVPEITSPKSIEIAEFIYADLPKKIAVGYKIGRSEYLAKGDIFAIRGKDMRLRGVARLDVVDSTTFGFSILAGTASVGDRAVIPTDEILAEISKKFPNNAAISQKNKPADNTEKKAAIPPLKPTPAATTEPQIDEVLGETIPLPAEE